MTQTPKPSTPVKPSEKRPLKNDVRGLRKRIARLASVPEKKQVDAICDIIDLGGVSLAVLLDRLPSLPEKIQESAAKKIEDFLFFHPNKGKRILSRLFTATLKAHESCGPSLISSIADVVSKMKKLPILPPEITEKAFGVMVSEADLVRRGKAVEVLAIQDAQEHITVILKALAEAMKKTDSYPGFQFAESALFALKQMGGDGLLRLLINPQSSEGLTQIKLEWRHRQKDRLKQVLETLEAFDENFAELILKVIDLSESNVSFLSAIHEGLTHGDKWVRQMATASLAKISNQTGLEKLTRMLGDSSQEVRMMAVSSLGAFPIAKSGSRLSLIAVSEKEPLEIRMNALYALYAQKNLAALQQIGEGPYGSLALNAKGLSSLLMPAPDGLKNMLSLMKTTPNEGVQELFHYLMELSKPEDLPTILDLYSSQPSPDRKQLFLDFLHSFLHSKAGPSLNKAIENLPSGPRKAIAILLPTA